MGRGLSAHIQEAYIVLAARYGPGDRIYMFGYFRGAFAVRSLSGIIDCVGLLRSGFATTRYVDRVWRCYRGSRRSEDVKSRNCHGDVKINMMEIYDTFSALSVNLPWVEQILHDNYSFHDHRMSDCVLAGDHALAFDETRAAYAPERWEADEIGAPCEVEQVWFSGSHVAIGGIFWGHEAARPLSSFEWIHPSVLWIAIGYWHGPSHCAKSEMRSSWTNTIGCTFARHPSGQKIAVVKAQPQRPVYRGPLFGVKGV